MRRGSELLREVVWVIFDEVHYMQVRPAPGPECLRALAVHMEELAKPLCTTGAASSSALLAQTCCSEFVHPQQ